MTEQREDRLSGVVAVVIAFTTLVAAVAGFLQADSSQLAGSRRDEAEQLALSALASSQSSRETAQVELETFARWVEQRTQAGNVELRELRTQRTAELSARADARSVSLIGVAALVIAALFFLTIAQVSRSRGRIRQVFFAGGSVLVLVGTFSFVLVELLA